MAILRPSVDNLRSLGNFTQMFRWSIQFVTFPANMDFDVSNDDINFRAESSTLPEKTGETTVIAIRGNEVRQPGIHKWNSPITLILDETIDPIVNQFLWSWQELCWESENGSTGVTQFQENLECDIILTQLNNLDQPIYEHKLFGCFVENGTLGTLDSSTSDPQKPEISIAFQRCERKKL